MLELINHLQDSELEAKTTEVEVLKETVEQLKQLVGQSAEAKSSSNGDDDADGWDCEDEGKIFMFSLHDGKRD